MPLFNSPKFPRKQKKITVVTDVALDPLKLPGEEKNLSVSLPRSPEDCEVSLLFTPRDEVRYQLPVRSAQSKLNVSCQLHNTTKHHKHSLTVSLCDAVL